MPKKKNVEEAKREFKVMCTQIENEGQKVSLIAGGIVEDGKWVDPNDMTLETIEAVRDFLISQIKDNDKGAGYQWKREDGKFVKLMLTIEDESAEAEPTEEAPVHEGIDDSAE